MSEYILHCSTDCLKFLSRFVKRRVFYGIFMIIFCLRKLRHLLCLVFIHSYRVKFVNKRFEIMDIKKCAAIPLNMYLEDSHTLFYTNIFTHNHKDERLKNVW